MKNLKKYDIVIIGSGLGGLVCGNILSREGYKVCVLEKHNQIGGCLQDFKRKGHLFDTGMHYIGSYGDGEVLNRLFKYFGVYDAIDVRKLDEKEFDIMYFGDEKFSYPQGIDNYKNKLIGMFPDEEEGIETYISRICKINDSIDLINLRKRESFNIEAIESMEVNVYDYIKSITSNKKLQNILGGLNSLYAGEKVSASLYMHAIITVFYIRSAWRLTGGGGQIAKAFRGVIEKNGGVVRVKSEVVKFNFTDDIISSVVLKNGELINGNTFISNAHPSVTMQLIEPGHLRKAYVKRIDSLKNTVSTFSVYIVLKEKVLEYKNSNVYFYKQDDVWGIEYNKLKTWPSGYAMYFTESKRHPGYASSMIILSTMEFEDVAKWSNTYIEERGDEYKQMKKQKAEDIFELVEEKFPDFREKIDSFYTSTPLTYRDYTGTKNGSMYGIAQDCNNQLQTVISPKTKIKNLFLTGQNINMHGVLGVSLVAILTCGEIVDINTIIKKITDEEK